MHITTPMQLGAELRNWRKRRGLTQAEAAENIGLMQKAVSAMEAHAETASVERLFMMLAALDLEFELHDKREPEANSLDW